MAPIATKPVLRYLRIGWAVFFGVLCILLVVAWQVRWGAFVNGGFPGVPRFTITSSSYAPSIWKHTVSSYFIFGLHARSDAYWLAGHLVGPSNVSEGFDFAINGEQWAITVNAPHWFILLICSPASVVPWMPNVCWPKHFSLRTLLIFTTLVAVVLGIIVWAVRK